MNDEEAHKVSALRQFAALGVNVNPERIMATKIRTIESEAPDKHPVTREEINQINRRLDALERQRQTSPIVLTNAIASDRGYRGVRRVY